MLLACVLSATPVLAEVCKGVDEASDGTATIALLSACLRAPDIDASTEASFLNTRGVALSGEGRFDEAIADFDIALRLDRNTSSFTHYNRGTTYLQMGRMDDALADLEASLAAIGEPLDITNQREVVVEHWQQNAFDRQWSAMVREQIAGAAVAAKRYELAEEQARFALLADPDCAACRLALGNGLAGQRQFDEAIKVYSETLTLARYDPRFTPYDLGYIYNGRAYSLLWTGSLADALADAEQVKVLQPDDPAPFELLGMIHAARGEHDAAFEAFQSVIDLSDQGRREGMQRGLVRLGMLMPDEDDDLRLALERGFEACIQARCDLWRVYLAEVEQ